MATKIKPSDIMIAFGYEKVEIPATKDNSIRSKYNLWQQIGKPEVYVPKRSRPIDLLNLLQWESFIKGHDEGVRIQKERIKQALGL